MEMGLWVAILVVLIVADLALKHVFPDVLPHPGSGYPGVWITRAPGH
jgi:hypothetical protein